MEEIQVKIVQLEPLRIASSLGFGSNPEELAFNKMVTFAQDKGLLVDGHLPVSYGFNNPNPSPGSPNYGYELWLPVSEDVQPIDGINIINFLGGLYAVTRCEGLEHIAEMWQKLASWRGNSKYGSGKHQWLEKLLTPPESDPAKYVFDLYMPISEA